MLIRIFRILWVGHMSFLFVHGVSEYLASFGLGGAATIWSDIFYSRTRRSIVAFHLCYFSYRLSAFKLMTPPQARTMPR